MDQGRPDVRAAGALSTTSAPGGDAAWRARERRRRRREGLLQGALAVALLLAAAGLVLNVGANLDARQIRSGFGFLADRAGFDIGESLISFTPEASYLRAFAAGMLNTLRVALAGIVLASVLGVAIGLLRLSQHPLASGFAGAWVEVARNVPLLIQLLALYLVITELLPESTAAWALDDAAMLSKQGLQVMAPQHFALAGLAALVAGTGAATFAWRLAGRRVMPGPAAGIALATALLAAVAVVFAAGAVGGWSRPELEGFLISGGLALTPEFLSLWLGLSFFTSGAIAEIVRAGALAVPRGQWDAALALGLTRSEAIRTVIFPQALRLAVPPLASQYMNLTKNSSLAVVIGYPDVVSIGNTSINQNGQALEVVAIIMAVYLVLNLILAAVMNAINARVTRAPR